MLNPIKFQKFRVYVSLLEGNCITSVVAFCLVLHLAKEAQSGSTHGLSGHPDAGPPLTPLTSRAARAVTSTNLTWLMVTSIVNSD